MSQSEIVIIDDGTTKQVIVSLLEYETNDPEKGDYLSLRVEVKSNGFSGWSKFWVRKNGLDQYIQKLEDFDRTLVGGADITCMVGKEIYFSMEIFPYDTLGHLGTRIELAAPDRLRLREKSLHRVAVEIALEPSQIPRIIEGFRRISTKPFME
jgi:hypothetical protein